MVFINEVEALILKARDEGITDDEILADLEGVVMAMKEEASDE